MIATFIMLVIIIVIVVAVVLTARKSHDAPVPVTDRPATPIVTLPSLRPPVATTPRATSPRPSPTADAQLDLQPSVYYKAAVAADAKECSDIGKEVLLRNGTAVDASVAVLFCMNLFNMHSCGIGGGGFMSVYIRQERKAFIYDFRETAPASSRKDMYVNSTFSSVNGECFNLQSK